MTSSAHPIYILGVGSVGSFIAHSLRSLPEPPPVTLLLHREDLYQEFASKGWKLGLQLGEYGVLEERTGFDVELLASKSAPVSTDPIHYLIVTVKASATTSALEPIKHRLGRHSTICLFQNGLGQIEDMNERVFTDPSTRPLYVLGIMQHGVYLKSPAEAVLSSSNGCATVGIVDHGNQTPARSHCQFLLDALLRSPTLRCTELMWADLLQVQLLKLAANCIINPLTALLDIRNGALIDSPELLSIQRLILKEISMVFENLPELSNLPRDQTRFSVASLEAAVLDTVEKTAPNSSSMREDIRKGRATEIEFINGWIVRRGKELGIDCVTNTCLTQMVLVKSRQSAKDDTAKV
ncbi:ketopantoate reductase family protein [Aspergillus thermomutatus]|uniref:2-dehydropantoate 2-reductase n=1 Tax=Aspergillus thermomutatus TaxID=41047 RepID=A0A397HY73_ASPTH|nr:uncharacterized protein CDV56_108755 [Aspergillus thermomutatus]RHZ65520.1 hypothetical protein CDV56_108755 [Aspergillus thermomutatus]